MLSSESVVRVSIQPLKPGLWIMRNISTYWESWNRSVWLSTTQSNSFKNLVLSCHVFFSICFVYITYGMIVFDANNLHQNCFYLFVCNDWGKKSQFFSLQILTLCKNKNRPKRAVFTWPTHWFIIWLLSPTILSNHQSWRSCQIGEIKQ